MRIRVTTLDDAAVLAPIYFDSYAALMAPSYEAATLAAALPAITAPQPDLLTSGTYFLAEDDSGVIGAGGWTLAAPGTGEVRPGLAHIRHFAVCPDRAGRGVGRALFERCRETARAEGVERFLCFSSLNGAPFYAALGFEENARREIQIGDGPAFPMIEMSMTLS